MLYTRKALNYISLVNDAYRFPPFLVIAGAFGDE